MAIGPLAAIARRRR